MTSKKGEVSKGSSGSECSGGNSFGCNRSTHPKGARFPDIYCRRCGQRMGCGFCVQIARELFCLNCKDWATHTALRAHGPIVRGEDERLRLIRGAPKF